MFLRRAVFEHLRQALRLILCRTASLAFIGRQLKVYN